MNAYALAYGDFVQELAQFHARNESLFAQGMDELDSKKGTTTNQVEREKIRQFMLDPTRYNFSIAKKTGLQTISLLEIIPKYLNAMSWTILNSPSQQLVTSDMPVTQVNLDKFNVTTEGGFTSKNSKVVISLNPHRALLCEWGDERQLASKTISPEFAFSLNTLQVRHAERFVYASQRDPAIAELASLNAKPGFRFEVSGASQRAKSSLTRK